MQGASRDTGVFHRFVNHPFELMVALVSLVPPIALGLDDGIYNSPLVMYQLPQPWLAMWVLICLAGGVMVSLGLWFNQIPPVVAGLRLTSLGWSTFFWYCEVGLQDPTPHIDLFVLAGAIIVVVSVLQAQRLSRRYKVLRRSVLKVGG